MTSYGQASMRDDPAFASNAWPVRGVGTDKSAVLRVLLIEDDDIDAKLVSLCASAIGRFQMVIERVVSSAEARARLATRSFDLCIVDFWLGCESSIRFLAELDKIAGGTPSLVLTSLSTPDIRKMCDMAGAAVFLGKADLSAASLENAVIRTLAAAKPVEVMVASALPREGLPQARSAQTPARFEVRRLRSMTETVRFGMFEAFWANGSKAATTAQPIDVADFISGATESTYAMLEERRQTVVFQRPDQAVTLSRDPASFFFLIFELLSRASRLSARDSTLTIALASDQREIRIDFQGGPRIDASVGALAPGPLCTQTLADQHATFADMADADGRFLLTVCFSIKNDAGLLSAAH